MREVALPPVFDSAPVLARVIRVTPLILAVALFMEQLDSTVIATSLPAIAAEIGTEPIALKLALTAYFVALAIFIPISGWMADRFGAPQSCGSWPSPCFVRNSALRFKLTVSGQRQGNGQWPSTGMMS